MPTTELHPTYCGKGRECNCIRLNDCLLVYHGPGLAGIVHPLVPGQSTACWVADCDQNAEWAQHRWLYRYGTRRRYLCDWHHQMGEMYGDAGLGIWPEGWPRF